MATETARELEEFVVDSIASFGPPREQITPDARLEDLAVDSLDLVELADIVEEKYGVVLERRDFEGVETVGDATEVLRSRIA